MPETCRLIVFSGPAEAGPLLPVVRMREVDGYESRLGSIAASGAALLLLADCRGVEDLQRCDLGLSVAEARAGREPASVGIVAGIGSAAGLLHLVQLEGRSGRLQGLAWDRQAFCSDVGCAIDSDVSNHARTTILVAARAFSLPAYEIVEA